MKIGVRRCGGGELVCASIDRCAVDVNGKPIGMPNENIFTDSKTNVLYYFDGMVEVLSANIITDNSSSQVDEEVWMQNIISTVIYHRVVPNVIPMKDSHYMTNS